MLKHKWTKPRIVKLVNCENCDIMEMSVEKAKEFKVPCYPRELQSCWESSDGMTGGIASNCYNSHTKKGCKICKRKSI